MEATGFSPIQQIESSGSKQDDSTESMATDREGKGHNPALCVVPGSASAPSNATWGLTDAGGAGTGTHTNADGDVSDVAVAVNSSDPQTVQSSSQEGVATGDASTIDYSMQGRVHGTTSVHGSSSSEDELLRVRRSSFEIQMALNEAEQRRLRALAEANALQEQEIRDRRAKKASREGSERSRASRPEVRSVAAPSHRGGSVASGDARRTSRAQYPRVVPAGAVPFSPPTFAKGIPLPHSPGTWPADGGADSGAASGGATPAMPAMAPGVNIKEELADIIDNDARAEETRRYLDAIALAHHRQLTTEVQAAEYVDRTRAIYQAEHQQLVAEATARIHAEAESVRLMREQAEKAPLKPKGYPSRGQWPMANGR